MTKLLFVLAAIVVAITIFTVVDVALTDARRARGVPKGAWFFIALIPVLGALLWFAVGKAPSGSTPQRRMVAPDDDPSFLSGLRREEEQNERIRQLEQELSDLDDDPPAEK